MSITWELRHKKNINVRYIFCKKVSFYEGILCGIIIIIRSLSEKILEFRFVCENSSPCIKHL